MAERENLDRLIADLARQSFKGFTAFFCVNQPDSWRSSSDPFHRRVVSDNDATLRLLGEGLPFDAVVVDRSSGGQGWPEGKGGVGQARKALFSLIAGRCGDDEIVVSLDADTAFPDDYLATLAAASPFEALAVPYRHPLAGDEALDRRLLRYECYMRWYQLNMMRIANPYAFTALGSALVFTVAAYRRSGGISPLQAGEDFYLLQKLAKTTTVRLALGSGCCVFPQGRLSSRVPFGTGPALALPFEVLEERYPFYAASSFDRVGETFALFPSLYDCDVETPMSSFLRQQLATDDLWSPLRRNFKSRRLFVRACAERVDGLRILQFLKHCSEREPSLAVDFAADPISRLEDFRELLFSREMAQRGLWQAGLAPWLDSVTDGV